MTTENSGMTDRKLMQMALDVIQSEFATGGQNLYDPDAVMNALRERLSQPEPDAVLDEREACAKLCEEDLRDAYLSQGKPARDEALLCAAIADCANAIRARGEK